MGTMEKAGIAVVGVLIAIIVAVGILNKKDANAEKDAGAKQPPSAADRQARDNAAPRSSPDVLVNRGQESKSGAGPEDGGAKAPVTPPSDPRGAARVDLDSGKTVEPVSPNVATGSTFMKPSGYPKKYTIKKGDVLTKISFREYGTNEMVKAIESHNGIKATALKDGSEIELPEPTPEVAKKMLADSTVAETPAVLAPVDGATVKTQPAATGTKAATGKTASKSTKRASSKPKRPSFITASFLANNLKSEKPAAAKGKSTRKGSKSKN
jgi:LysM repeat protein